LSSAAPVRCVPPVCAQNLFRNVTLVGLGLELHPEY
jgi:hypothetical protein